MTEQQQQQQYTTLNALNSSLGEYGSLENNGPADQEDYLELTEKQQQQQPQQQQPEIYTDLITYQTPDNSIYEGAQ